MANSKAWGGVVAGVGIIALLTVGFIGETHVSLGHVGMVKHPNGQVTEVGQGWHWTGLQNSVEEYPTYLQGTKYNLTVGTADSQKMPMQININWQLNTKDATTLYNMVGGKSVDYVQTNIIDQKVQGIVQQVTHQYKWDDLLGSSMPDATKQIQDELAQQLSSDGIILDSVFIGEVSAPSGMASAQQATAQAELGKEKAIAQQDQVKIENQTKYMQAQNDLNIKKLEAEANQKVSQSLSPLLIEQQWIEAWKATGGHVPTTMLGNGTTTMFTLPSDSTSSK